MKAIKRLLVFLMMVFTFSFAEAQSFDFKGAKGYSIELTDSTMIMTTPQMTVESDIKVIAPLNMETGGAFMVEAIDGTTCKYVIYPVKDKWYMGMAIKDGFSGVVTNSQVELKLTKPKN